MTRNPLGLTPLEIAGGSIFGEAPGTEPLPPPRHADDPAVALQRVMTPALARGPCLVSFSGGRDSSLILAAATAAAHYEGLPRPVPVTFRIPGDSDSDESAWQERVVRWLGLSDWERLEAPVELDFLGPISRKVLERHGLLFPANAYTHAHMVEQAPGGTLLTGFGGDHLFVTWRWQRAQAVLTGRRPGRPSDVLRAGVFLAPWRVARPVVRLRLARLAPTWLSEQALAAFMDGWVAESRQPRRWDAWLEWLARRRILAVTRRSLDLLAADAGAAIEHPFLAPGFLAALARAGGYAGWPDRTAALVANFSTLLPRDVLERRSKASFGRAFARAETRRFAEQWRGEGVDHALVDVEALRAAWLEPDANVGAMMLLHAAWLATRGNGTGAAAT